MKDAKLIKVFPGIVKSKGLVEISNPGSPFHKRDYTGVVEQQIGWIDNSAMKFTALVMLKRSFKSLKNKNMSRRML